ncbi:MAG: hypothetical protein U1E65_01035 [Myxococcota bacterium]
MKRADPGTIVASIEAEHQGQGLVSTLAQGLSDSELSSVLLYALRERARRQRPGDVLRFVERSSLVQPSTIDAREMHALTGLFWEAAAAFPGVELSPVSTLGANHLAGVDQNNVLSATRGTELVADPTTALAAHAARLRRPTTERAALHRFATSHRLIRMQPFDNPSFSRHFRLFALASAGRDRGDERFEIGALIDHVTVWARLSAALGQAGYGLSGVRVEISDTRVMRAIVREAGIAPEALKGHVSPDKENSLRGRFGLDLPRPHPDPAAALPPGQQQEARRFQRIRAALEGPLGAANPDAELCFDFDKLHGLAYYEGLSLAVSYRSAQGAWIPIIDGGASTWTQTMLSDKKERFFASAIGAELIVKAFGRTPR